MGEIPIDVRRFLVSVCVAIALAPVTLHAAQPKTLEIGAAAPDFSLPGVDGKRYALADFKDADILVVVFTCNHCPTAQAYEERIKQLAADYKERGVAVVAIQGKVARLGISAPAKITIHRAEVWKQVDYEARSITTADDADQRG